MKNNEIYISTDVETDGPIPGPNSMLSLGAGAFTPDGKLVSTFSANLQTLPDAVPNPDTMEWWKKNQEAYDATREGTRPADQVMRQFSTWVSSQEGKPVFVGYPAGFDFLFVYWYLINFTGFSPFSFSAVDIKTYAMAMMKTEYRQSTKKNMPKRWFSDDVHTHVAVEDAVEQGKLFCNMLKENTKSR
jgi:DNA polymerase III alpha subunit (gram-positive type)